MKKRLLFMAAGMLSCLGVMAQTILSQNFGTSSSNPSGWTVGSGWGQTTTGNTAQHSSVIGGSGSYWTSAIGLSGFLVTPAFSTVGYTDVIVSFFHTTRNYNLTDNVKIEGSIDGGSTWNNIGTFTINAYLSWKNMSTTPSQSTFAAADGSTYSSTSGLKLISSYEGKSNVKLRFSNVTSGGQFHMDDFSVRGTQPCTPPTLSLTPTDVSCFGGNNGAIDLAVTGTSTYTYNWGSGITTEDRTNLPAGSYSVTVSQVGYATCNATASVTVSQPSSAVSGSTVVTNVACNGGNTGAINLIPSGGTPGYTFLWNDGATTEDRTGLEAGIRSVTITDSKGCATTVANVAVTQPTVLSIGNSVANPTCDNKNNGIISLMPTGGVGPYTYNWTNGATVATLNEVPVGDYDVTVTDANNCTATEAFSLTAPMPVDAELSVTGPSFICNGNPAVFTASGNALDGGTYNWYRNGELIENENGSTLTLSNISPSNTESIYAEVTNIAACVNNTTATASAVTALSTPSPLAAVSVTEGSRTLCAGKLEEVSFSLQFTSTSGQPINQMPLGYQWTKNGDDITGATSATYTATSAGVYNLVLTDLTTTCVKTSSPQNVVLNTPPAAAITTVASTDICPGVAVVLTASTTPSATTKWRRGTAVVGTAATYSAKVAGDYTLITTLNGCSDTSAITPVTIKNIDATISYNTPLAFCTGQSVTLNAVINPDYNYTWYKSSTAVGTGPSYEATTAGLYSLGVVSGTCPEKKSASLRTTTTTTPTATVGATYKYPSSWTLRATGGTGLSYQWYRGGIQLFGATNRDYNATVNGSYTVVVTRGECSDSLSTGYDVNLTNPAPPDRLTIAEETQAITVYPNPSEGTFYIAAEKAVNVIVRDIQGKVIANLTNATSVDLSAQPAGIYLMQVMDVKGNLIHTQRLMKN